MAALYSVRIKSSKMVQEDSPDSMGQNGQASATQSEKQRTSPGMQEFSKLIGNPSDKHMNENENGSGVADPTQGLLNAYILDYLLKYRLLRSATVFLQEANVSVKSPDMSGNRPNNTSPLNTEIDGSENERGDSKISSVHSHLGSLKSANSPIIDNKDHINEISSDQHDTQQHLETIKPDIPIDIPNAFLLEWWGMFWDILKARASRSGSPAANAYIAHAQRLRQEQLKMLSQAEQGLVPPVTGQFEDASLANSASTRNIRNLYNTYLRNQGQQAAANYGNDKPVNGLESQIYGNQIANDKTRQFLMRQAMLNNSKRGMTDSGPIMAHAQQMKDWAMVAASQGPEQHNSNPLNMNHLMKSGSHGFDPQRLPNKMPSRSEAGDSQKMELAGNMRNNTPPNAKRPRFSPESQYPNLADGRGHNQAAIAKNAKLAPGSNDGSNNPQIQFNGMSLNYNAHNIMGPNAVNQGGYSPASMGHQRNNVSSKDMKMNQSLDNSKYNFSPNTYSDLNLHQIQANQAGGMNALQDYQMQLMLLEEQNKKRLGMASQRHDSERAPSAQDNSNLVANSFQGQPRTQTGIGEGARRINGKVSQIQQSGSPVDMHSVVQQNMRNNPAGQMPQDIQQQMRLYEQLKNNPAYTMNAQGPGMQKFNPGFINPNYANQMQMMIPEGVPLGEDGNRIAAANRHKKRGKNWQDQQQQQLQSQQQILQHIAMQQRAQGRSHADVQVNQQMQNQGQLQNGDLGQVARNVVTPHMQNTGSMKQNVASRQSQIAPQLQLQQLQQQNSQQQVQQQSQFQRNQSSRMPIMGQAKSVPLVKRKDSKESKKTVKIRRSEGGLAPATPSASEQLTPTSSCTPMNHQSQIQQPLQQSQQQSMQQSQQASTVTDNEPQTGVSMQIDSYENLESELPLEFTGAAGSDENLSLADFDFERFLNDNSENAALNFDFLNVNTVSRD